jgi:hypothetical protein
VSALVAVRVGDGNLLGIETQIVDERGIVVHSTAYSATSKVLAVPGDLQRSFGPKYLE